MLRRRITGTKDRKWIHEAASKLDRGPAVSAAIVTSLLRWAGMATLCVLAACDPGSRRGEVDLDPAAYPSRPVEIVSWATPGGPSDLLARAIARVGERHFGHPIRVVTREGGAGAAGMAYLRSKSGDPYTLGVFTSSGAINMATGLTPFSPEDFTFVARIQLDPFLIATRSDEPFEDLRDFFSAGVASPGTLSMAGFGTASAHFLAFAQLQALAGSPDIRWIAYEGSSDAVVAALGGHTDAVHTNYNIVREHLRAGTMKVLGVAQEISALPSVSTYTEQGYQLSPSHWRGVVAPSGLSAALVDRIRFLLLATTADPEFVEFMESSETDLGLMESSEDFRQWVVDQVETSRHLMEGLGLLSQGVG